MTDATETKLLEPVAPGYPASFCPTGSILNLSCDDWDSIAHQDKMRAQRSDLRAIQARRRKELHKSMCPRCIHGR